MDPSSMKTIGSMPKRTEDWKIPLTEDMSEPTSIPSSAKVASANTANLQFAEGPVAAGHGPTGASMTGLTNAGLSSMTAIEAPGIRIFGVFLATSISSSWSFAAAEPIEKAWPIPEEVVSMAGASMIGASRIGAGRSRTGSVSRGGGATSISSY
jgi:hypothetical protein